MSQVIQDSIAIYETLLGRSMEGDVIIIRNKDGVERELVLAQ